MLPSPSEILEAVGLGLLVPAAVAVLGLWLALRLGGGESLGVGAGLAAGFAALAASQSDRSILRPDESWDWLPALGLAAAVAAAVEQLARRPKGVSWPVRVAVAALAAVLLVRTQSQSRGSVNDLWYGALLVAVLVLWALLDLAVRRRPGATVPALLTAVAFAAAGLGEMGGFLTLAQRAGVVAAALAGWAIVAWRRPLPGVCRAGVAAFAVLLPGVLFVESFNRSGDVPTAASYFLVLAAPLALGAMSLLQLGKSARRTAVILGAVTVVPLVVALALAART